MLPVFHDEARRHHTVANRFIGDPYAAFGVTTEGYARIASRINA